MQYHDIEINLDNITNFLINYKRQDSLLINALNNVDIYKEFPMIVEKNDLNIEEDETAHSISHNTPIPVLFE